MGLQLAFEAHTDLVSKHFDVGVRGPGSKPLLNIVLLISPQARVGLLVQLLRRLDHGNGSPREGGGRAYSNWSSGRACSNSVHSNNYGLISIDFHQFFGYVARAQIFLNLFMPAQPSLGNLNQMF